MTEEQQRLRRVERIVEVRQSFVTAAEGRVHEAEQYHRSCQEIADERDRQIRQVREEIAYLDHSTGEAIQNREKYIFSLHVRARQAREILEKARKVLEARRLEWRETMRDKKVIERVQDQRLLEWQQSVNIAHQKGVDEMTIGRYARNKIDRNSHDSGPADNAGSDPESGVRPGK